MGDGYNDTLLSMGLDPSDPDALQDHLNRIEEETMNELTERNPNDTLLLNRIRTPDGTVLTSRHVHDYNTHLDDNGLEYMVDGGKSYLRRNIHVGQPYEELSLYESDDFEVLRKEICWGRRVGPMGLKIQYIPIASMSKAHINAIIEDGYRGAIVKLMHKELKWRKSHESKSEAKRMEIQREKSYG